MTRNCLNVMRKVASMEKEAEEVYRVPAPTTAELQKGMDAVHRRRLRSRLPILPSKYDTPAGVGGWDRSDYMTLIDARNARDPFAIEKATGYAAYPARFQPNYFKRKPILNSELYRRRGYEADDMATTMFGRHNAMNEDAYQHFLNAGEHNANVYTSGYMNRRGVALGGGHAPRYSGKNIKDPKAIVAVNEYGKLIK